MFRQSSRSLLSLSLYLGVVLVTIEHTNAILIAAGPKQEEDRQSSNRSTGAHFNALPSTSPSVEVDNSLFTKRQGFKLKEIRKLARQAGHEHPEMVTEYSENVCYKHDCLSAATEFFSAMDFSQEPCDDWGKFACEWRTLSAKTAMDQQSDLALKAESQLREILLDKNIEKNAIKLAQEYHSSCIAWFQDFSKTDHILSYLETYGNWPLLTGKSDQEGNWTKLLARLLKILPENVSPILFRLDAVGVSKNKVVLQIDSGVNSLDLTSDDVKLLLQIFRKKPASDPQKEIEEIREMFKTIQVLASNGFDVYLSEKAKLTTLNDIQNKIQSEIADPKVNILSLVQSVVGSKALKISPETEVLTETDALVAYVKAIQSVNTRALVNILFLQLASVLLGDTTNVLQVNGLMHFENYKRIIQKEPTRQCTKETSELFGFALSEEFISRRHFDSNATKMVNSLTESIKGGFIDTVDSIKWLEKSTKDFLRDKVRKVEVFIGFPSWVEDELKVEQYYKNLEFLRSLNSTGSKAYIKYRMNMISWVNGNYWKMKLQDEVMNAWNYKLKNGFVGDTSVEYVRSLNQMRIPAGILQPPMFSVDYPGFMNFGGFGSVFARELASIFDSYGIFINSDGENGLWFDNNSYKSYIDWTMRVQNDWNRNEVDLNCKIGNIVAYNTVVKAYRLYLDDLNQSSKTEIDLPGLGVLSPEKLFQLKYTNVLCDSSTFRETETDDPEKSESGVSNSNSRGLFIIPKMRHFINLFGCEVERFSTSFDFN